MIAVDTNVLVRILIDEPAANTQVKTARAFARKNAKLFIPQVVQIELVWVLTGAYTADKHEIVTLLEHLANNESFIIQNEAQFLAALSLFKNTNVGFADCLIAIESEQQDCALVTFDKKLSKLPNVKLLET